MRSERFYHILRYPGTYSFFSWIRIRIILAWIRMRIRIKVCPGSGSVTNFFTSWIRICIKMIQIRNIVSQHTLHHTLYNTLFCLFWDWEIGENSVFPPVFTTSKHWKPIKSSTELHDLDYCIETADFWSQHTLHHTLFKILVAKSASGGADAEAYVTQRIQELLE